MKILVTSYAFYPSVGGIETAAELLSLGFIKKGHEVKLVTYTPASSSDKSFRYEVIRRPTLRKLFELTLWADIVFQNNMSLNFVWPLLFIKKPWAITHQTWLRKPDGNIGWNDNLKRFAAKFATNIAVSQAVADDLGLYCAIILHPYDEEVFKKMEGIQKNKELVFVGRLVSDKGVDDLLKALKLLKGIGQNLSLTVVGDGPEKNKLRELAVKTDIAKQVSFVGVKKGIELAALLNAHKILVVPSKWREPSGGVAMEGIACGCVVVGSQEGGLPATIGPCGLTFPNGDTQALSQAIYRLISDRGLLDSYVTNAETHTAPHTINKTADRYLEIFEKAIEKH